jgi:large subunit ribosomal protein L22
MEVKAKVKNLRISPKKVRLVIDLIRGKDALKAQEMLRFIPKQAARPVLKLLNQAISSAENNFSLKAENLFIKKIIANEGQKLKRWRPRAFGRATPILKRATHVELILAEKVPSSVSSKKKLTQTLSKEKLKKSLKSLSLKEIKKDKAISQKKLDEKNNLKKSDEKKLSYKKDKSLRKSDKNA